MPDIGSINGLECDRNPLMTIESDVQQSMVIQVLINNSYKIHRFVEVMVKRPQHIYPHGGVKAIAIVHQGVTRRRTRHYRRLRFSVLCNASITSRVASAVQCSFLNQSCWRGWYNDASAGVDLLRILSRTLSAVSSNTHVVIRSRHDIITGFLIASYFAPVDGNKTLSLGSFVCGGLSFCTRSVPFFPPNYYFNPGHNRWSQFNPPCRGEGERSRQEVRASLWNRTRSLLPGNHARSPLEQWLAHKTLRQK